MMRGGHVEYTIVYRAVFRKENMKPHTPRERSGSKQAGVDPLSNSKWPAFAVIMLWFGGFCRRSALHVFSLASPRLA